MIAERMKFSLSTLVLLTVIIACVIALLIQRSDKREFIEKSINGGVVFCLSASNLNESLSGRGEKRKLLQRVYDLFRYQDDVFLFLKYSNEVDLGDLRFVLRESLRVLEAENSEAFFDSFESEFVRELEDSTRADFRNFLKDCGLNE